MCVSIWVPVDDSLKGLWGCYTRPHCGLIVRILGMEKKKGEREKTKNFFRTGLEAQELKNYNTTICSHILKLTVTPRVLGYSYPKEFCTAFVYKQNTLLFPSSPQSLTPQ